MSSNGKRISPVDATGPVAIGSPLHRLLQLMASKAAAASKAMRKERNAVKGGLIRSGGRKRI
jgi:hypothetical protein